jgi:hypothetical protein
LNPLRHFLRSSSATKKLVPDFYPRFRILVLAFGGARPIAGFFPSGSFSDGPQHCSYGQNHAWCQACDPALRRAQEETEHRTKQLGSLSINQQFNASSFQQKQSDESIE